MSMLVGADARIHYTNKRGEVLRMYSPEDAARLEALRQATYFLVVNGGADEPARCVNCGRKHAYLTRACTEQPFRGLRGALYRYAKITNDGKLRMRLNGIHDLANLHPRTARDLQSEDAEGEDILAFELGAAIPISTERAMRYVEALKLRRVMPPYILES